MAKIMKEGIVLPPPWCGAICRNAMGEKCLTECAIKRDCSSFQVKQGLKLADMTHMPDSSKLTREEKFTVVYVYLAKIVDNLQGADDDNTYPIRRSYSNHSPSSQIPSAIPTQSVLSGIQEAITPPETRQEYSSTTVRSSEVAQSAD